MRTIEDIRMIVYRREDADEPMVRRFRDLPGREIVEIDDASFRSDDIRALAAGRGYTSKEVVVLTRFKGRLVQECPCSPGMVRCGYRVVNTAFNCLFDCAYCYLHLYLNSFGIVQFVNQEETLERLAAFARGNPHRVIRVGSGEFTDSMMYDELTGFGAACAELSSRFPNLFIELKTKSSLVRHLPPAAGGNMVLAWSLNTPSFVARYEAGTAALDDRLSAAAAATEAGYLAAFHFDPVIIEGDGWADEYCAVVDRLFEAVDPARVAWISLGCFRYAPGFREASRDDEASRRLLAGELFPGPDGKYRYLRRERVNVYRTLVERIRRHGEVFVYLCMETPSVWRSVFGVDVARGDEVEQMFESDLRRRFLP